MFCHLFIMAHTSMQKFKTLHSPACRKDQDNDSNGGKPSCGTVEDVKDWRSKRKASTHKGSSKKNLRPSSSHSVISGGTSVRGNKWKTDTNEDCPKKKIRGSNDANTNEPSIVFIEGSHVRQSERKAHNDTDSSSKMQRFDLSLSSSICSSSDEDNIYGIPFSVKTSRAEFEANYIEIYKIAKGGFGAVYAGYRKEDVASVAIKHIPKEKVQYSKVVNNGKVYKVIDEVALMVKAAGGAESPGRSAAISLLDCYDLEEDLLLIMERPVPSMDLHQYRNAKRGFLLEDEAKTILRQMVDAAIEMHTNGVFHRDIKLENILIETGSHVLRARVIDFGCGCLMIKGYYYRYSGTLSKAPPEWFMFKRYKASPTTVWQLGALLYDLLDHDYSFKTRIYLERGLKINCNLSIDCQEFLHMCLVRNPNRRPSLEQLQLHPWLI